MSLKTKISDLSTVLTDGMNRLNDSFVGHYHLEFPYSGTQVFPLDWEALGIRSVRVNGIKLSASQYKFRYNIVEIVDQLHANDYIQIDYYISLVNDEIYGMIIDQNTAAPEVERVGNMDLHIDQPIQSGIRRCTVNDDASVNYYFDPTDITKSAGGGPAKTDGTDGQVMGEIPRHWRRFTQIRPNVWLGAFSLKPFPGAHEVKSIYGNRPIYAGSYKASLERSTNKLSSVCNLSADYRGGNNQSSWDSENEYKSQLGKPVTQRDRIQFHASAKNRGDMWNESDYYCRNAISLLMTLELGTRHHQSALSVGPTNLNGGDWLTFNNRYPLFRCGLTNSLNNGTGEIPVTVQDFPATGQSANTQVFSWRGIENWYGDIWEWTNGINFDHENNMAYVRVGPEVSSNSYDGYRPVPMAGSNGYVDKMAIGPYGDLIPASTSGASSSTYWTDYLYQNPGALRGLLASGAVHTGAHAGSFVSYSHLAPTSSSATLGSRLFLI